MRSSAILVCSPHAGTQRPMSETVDALREAGVDVVRCLTVADLPEVPPGPAWAAEGVDLAIAAGGDGTISAVATAVDDAPITLGILPLGTNNDSARSLGLPLGLEAVEVLGRGRDLAVDVGEVVDAAGRRCRFLHAATVGLNAEFARLATDVERRSRLGPLTYPVSAVETLVNARAREIRVVLDDREVLEGTALQVAALNLPHLLGGTLGVDLPDLGPDDGKLVVLVARNLLKIERHECRTVELSMEGEARVTVDGELCGPAPARVTLAHRRLRVRVP